MADEKQTPARERIPSSTALNDELAVVVVDQWGHKGEYRRGDIVRLSELNPSEYDGKWAVTMGTLRMLTEAEAREGSYPTTQPLDQNGEPDEVHRRVMRYHAGFIDEAEHVTVTTPSGPPEPAEFAKPTVEYTGKGGDAPYPIKVVGSAEEVAEAQPRTPETVRTPSGPAYASPDDEPVNEQRLHRGRGRG